MKSTYAVANYANVWGTDQDKVLFVNDLKEKPFKNIENNDIIMKRRQIKRLEFICFICI